MKFYKGILSITVSALLLCGCAKNESSFESEINNTVDSESVTSDDNIISTEINEKYWIAHRYREDQFGYSICVPDINYGIQGFGYISIDGEEGNTELGRENEVLYITQYSGDVGDERQKDRVDMSQYTSSTDILDLLIKNMNIELFCFADVPSSGGFSLVDYSYDTLETSYINGVEMTKFEGEICVLFKGMESIGVEDREYPYPFVAYGIKSSKTPILVLAYDTTPGSVMHEEWKSKIDDVVATFEDCE